ncbi:type II toxin-antitoxin system VapC family toxin [Aquabacterium humicola]|uniref:type II toxin-antitoxin system VapC family toxin n=1 Tax=Aquabacterium humicola TaxID=3237377 RepID=UPI002542B11D|nr:type II toxin-antitoxin system VapC family toxin [Rubrivivax pictus]
MIAVDTNILARFYCDDPSDPEAKRQRPAAYKVMVGPAPVFVPLTVVLEFEWVMRGFYEAEPAAFCDALAHLLGMPHVTVDRWQAAKDAAELHREGFDFADALHWALSAGCERLISFDDRRFVRRAKRRGLTPAVELPAP